MILPKCFVPVDSFNVYSGFLIPREDTHTEVALFNITNKYLGLDLIIIGMAMIQNNLPIHVTKTEILITCTSSCYGFIMMAERAFNLKETFGTAGASNDAIWRCSDKWPLRINEQSTFCYLQVSMLEPNCFFIPVPGFFHACNPNLSA